jgi:multiple sugar transport system substrate-binding protein
MLANAQQVRLFRLTGDLPARRAPWSLPPLAADPKLKAFRTQLERVRPFAKIPEWGEIMHGMRRMAEQVVIGGASVDAATDQLDRRVNYWLAERRALLKREDRSADAPAAGRRP